MSNTNRDSFYPAAKKVFTNPIVKWVGGGLIGLLMAALTTGVWPFFKGWVATRADTETVRQIDKRVVKIEGDLEVDFERLDSAKKDDTTALTQGEQLQWAVIRIKRLQMKLVAETRARIGLEARLRMPRPNSKAAQQVAASVKAKFDDLVFKGEDPTIAAQKALESVYGVEE
jgi:hypothetical protein